MKTNRTIVSLFVTAALSLPLFAHAAGAQYQFPGTTDEARAAAAELINQKDAVQSVRAYDPATPVIASSTDEARALAGQRQVKQDKLASPSDCTNAGVVVGSTDEARAAFGERLDGALAGCTQHAQSSGTAAIR